MQNVGSVLLLLGWCLLWNTVEGSLAAEKDLSLTTTEKQSLDKFKKVISPLVYNDRYKTEAYLVRWLRATQFDMKRAETMLLKNVEWREELNMNEIQDEDWSEFQEKYPYGVSIDKEFQPVITSRMGDWDIRQAILAGKRNKMSRYIFKMLDELEVNIRKRQDEGKIVTRGVVLWDLSGYSLVQHGCVPCIGLYIEMIRALDNYYPGLYDKLILVNVPATFEAVLNIIKQAMSPETRKSIQVFGTNRQKWQKYLFAMIDQDELPLEFGGNKINLSANNF